MQKTARERSLALYHMVNQIDVFERDETFMEFNRFARVFIQARQALLEMPLSDTEKMLIARQGELSQRAVPLQNRIIDLANENKLSLATNMLIKESIPAQNAVLDVLEKLLNYQTSNNENIVHQLEHKLNNNIILIFVTGITLFVLTIVITIFDTRRILKTEQQLFIEKELAQVTLHSTKNINHEIKLISRIAVLLFFSDRYQTPYKYFG